MIALIDYGAGNLRSVEKALRYVGAELRVVTRPEGLRDAAAVVLPGVFWAYLAASSAARFQTFA